MVHSLVNQCELLRVNCGGWHRPRALLWGDGGSNPGGYGLADVIRPVIRFHSPLSSLLSPSSVSHLLSTHCLRPHLTSHLSSETRCKLRWMRWRAMSARPYREGDRVCVLQGRGIHSSTFQLNISALCGIGGAFRGCLRGDWQVPWYMRGCIGCVLRQKRLRLS